MQFLSRITVGAKLGLGFTTALLLLAVSGGLSINDLADMNGEVHKFSEARLPSVEAASAVAQAITDYRLADTDSSPTRPTNAKPQRSGWTPSVTGLSAIWTSPGAGPRATLNASWPRP